MQLKEKTTHFVIISDFNLDVLINWAPRSPCLIFNGSRGGGGGGVLNHPLYLGSCALLLSCDHVFWNDPSVLPDCGKRRIRGGY